MVRRSFMLACLLASMLSVMAVTSRRMFLTYNASNGLADNSAQTIRCATSGRLVITTMGQINFFDGNRFSYIDPSKESVYSLPSYSGNYHVYVDKDRHLWLKNTHTSMLGKNSCLLFSLITSIEMVKSLSVSDSVFFVYS